MFMQIQILSVYHTCNEAKRGGGTEWVVGWVRHDALGRPSSVGMQKKKQNKKYIAINITKAHGVADTCI